MLKRVLFLVLAFLGLFGTWVAVKSASGATVCVTFTAPADYVAANDTTKYRVAAYEFYVKTSPFDSTNWQTATVATGFTTVTPKAPGVNEVLCNLTGLSFSTKYWIAMRSRDGALDSLGAPAYNWSKLSNVITKYTQDLISPSSVTDLR